MASSALPPPLVQLGAQRLQLLELLEGGVLQDLREERRSPRAVSVGDAVLAQAPLVALLGRPSRPCSAVAAGGRLRPGRRGGAPRAATRLVDALAPPRRAAPGARRPGRAGSGSPRERRDRSDAPGVGFAGREQRQQVLARHVGPRHPLRAPRRSRPSTARSSTARTVALPTDSLGLRRLLRGRGGGQRVDQGRDEAELLRSGRSTRAGAVPVSDPSISSFKATRASAQRRSSTSRSAAAACARIASETSGSAGVVPVPDGVGRRRSAVSGSA